MLQKNQNKIKFLSVILMLALGSHLSAQVPGYMGKRLSVGYSNYLAPALFGPGANANTSDGTIGLNTTHCLNLDFAVKPRTLLCLSLQRSNTGVNPSELVEEGYNSFSGGYYTYYYDYDPKPYRPMQLSSTNIGVGLKFFQSGTIAPVGKYKKVEVLFLMNSLMYSNTAFRYYDIQSSSSSFAYKKVGKGVYKYRSAAISYTMGRSRVLFNRVVLDYGFRIGFVPEPFVNFVVNDFFGDGYTSNNTALVPQRTFRKDVYNRLFRSQLLNLHIGLSFLAI